MSKKPCCKRSSESWLLTAMLLLACIGCSQTDAQPGSLEVAGERTLPHLIQADNLESSAMNNQRLGRLLKKHFPGEKIEGQLGLWRITLAAEESTKKEAVIPEETRDDKAEKQSAAGDDLLPANGKPTEQERKPDSENAAPGNGERLPAVLFVMTDERADRMRVMVPIRPFDPQRVEDLQLGLIALHANYDRALDARYAVNEGVLWSVFIHPLGSLTPADLANALGQVQKLRENTGTSYSSSDLLFGAPAGEEENGPAEKAPQAKIPDADIT